LQTVGKRYLEDGPDPIALTFIEVREPELDAKKRSLQYSGICSSQLLRAESVSLTTYSRYFVWSDEASLVIHLFFLVGYYQRGCHLDECADIVKQNTHGHLEGKIIKAHELKHQDEEGHS
jgi:hypothetical protein